MYSGSVIDKHYMPANADGALMKALDSQPQWWRYWQVVQDTGKDHQHRPEQDADLKGRRKGDNDHSK
jgi:hypothetical protein